MHKEDKRWLSPKQIMDLYNLPITCPFKILQVLSICKSRLRDLSREGAATVFDDRVAMPGKSYGLLNLYWSVRKLFARNSSPAMFKAWENIISTPDYVKVILGGWSSVRKDVLCESWRESHFKLIHKAIYGFNIPRSEDNPTRIIACPKCQAPRTDM